MTMRKRLENFIVFVGLAAISVPFVDALPPTQLEYGFCGMPFYTLEELKKGMPRTNPAS
jgi:hypothetical protein